MRARTTLILILVAVLSAVAPVDVAIAAEEPQAAAGRLSWFSVATSGAVKRLDGLIRIDEIVEAERAPVVEVAPPASDPTSYVWPAAGPITSPFGRRWGRRHDGVDIDAPTGSAIVATQSGVVIHADWKNGYGRTVIIDHGFGIRTLYAHQSKLAVTTGQHVDQGQYLGAVGASGDVTAAHLHYEVYVNGVPNNPTPWLPG